MDVNFRMGEFEGVFGGCSVLYMVVYRGDVSVIEILISFRVDLDFWDKEERIFVFYVYCVNNFLVVKIFRKLGVDMLSCDNGIFKES